MPVAANPGEESGAFGPVTRAVRRFVLATQRGPLRVFWRWSYIVVARAFLAYLRRGHKGAAGYLIGGLGAGDAVYGNSDVDVVVVLRGRASREQLTAVRARWETLVERVPISRLILDDPQVYSEDLLRGAGGSMLTHGLDGAPAPYSGPSWNGPLFRLLARPGLHGPGTRWRRVTGPEYRPALPAPDRQEHRIAAWLELQRWWREAFPLCAWPDHPLAADICVKLVAEPARVWLWLEHGERPQGRDAVLERAAELLPEHGAGLRDIARLRERLGRSPRAPLAESLRTMLGLSLEIAATIERETADAAFTTVHLDGAADRLLLPKGGLRPGSDLLPLCDWPELVAPELPDAAFGHLHADPGDPVAVGAAARLSVRGAFPVLGGGRLIVMPTVRWTRGLLRAVASPLTDPVTFALLSGSTVARFPERRGWAARDWALRGHAEHAARREQRAPVSSGKALGAALTAARAALFHRSLEAGRPRLALTTAATLRALSDEIGEGLVEEVGLAYERFADTKAEPPAPVVEAFTAAVGELSGNHEAHPGSDQVGVARPDRD